VLEVGPSPSQVTHFPRPQFLGEARYTAVDTRRSALHDALKVPHRFLPMDVTHMTFSDQSFDIILCQQVLPFVRSDYQAMSEMHRCLKTTGIALLNAHRPLDKTRPASEMRAENPALYSDEYLAENGNEWVYGEDYFERLEAAGFFPHELALAPWVESDFAERQLFAPSAKLVLCFKFRDQKNRFLGAL
jgi:ubiquinone/menaquinone biosynthesis C-methylase UbiE